jgi:hypothetical protein
MTGLPAEAQPTTHGTLFGPTAIDDAQPVPSGSQTM